MIDISSQELGQRQYKPQECGDMTGSGMVGLVGCCAVNQIGIRA